MADTTQALQTEINARTPALLEGEFMNVGQEH